MRKDRPLFSLLIGVLVPLLWSGCIGGDNDDSAEVEQALSEVDWRLDDNFASVVHVSWVQAREATGTVRWRLDGEDWNQTPTATYGAGAQEQVVLGVPYEMNAEVQVVLDDVESDVLAVETGALPEASLKASLLASEPDLWESTGDYMLGSLNATTSGWTSGDYYIFILDRQARVVWAYLTPDENFCIHAGFSLDETALVWDEITYWTAYDQGEASMAHWMLLDGTILESVSIPGANHAFTELPDGSLSWWAMDLELGSGDGSLQVLRPDGSTDVLFQCADYMESAGLGSGVCFANTVFYHETSDTFFISFAIEDFVVEVNQDGDVLRTFGQVNGAYTFDPEDSTFWMQHAVNITEDGTFLMSAQVNSGTKEAIIREYTFDDEEEVLRQVWSFAEGGTEARLGGYVHRYPEGTTLQSFGTTPRVKEVASDGTVVWDVEWADGGQIGRTLFFDDLYKYWPSTSRK